MHIVAIGCWAIWLGERGRCAPDTKAWRHNLCRTRSGEIHMKMNSQIQLIIRLKRYTRPGPWSMLNICWRPFLCYVQKKGRMLYIGRIQIPSFLISVQISMCVSQTLILKKRKKQRCLSEWILRCDNMKLDGCWEWHRVREQEYRVVDEIQVLAVLEILAI